MNPQPPLHRPAVPTHLRAILEPEAAMALTEALVPPDEAIAAACARAYRDCTQASPPLTREAFSDAV